MSNISDKSSNPKPLFSVRTIVIAAIVWAVLALLFFLLFSITPPGEERPKWYLIGTYVFEEVAYLSAAILCFRNWRSPQIVSGRQVWLGIGLGMLFYFLGNLLFGFWELIWQLEPDVSLGDIFFIGTYISLGWGMIQAVIARRLNLEKWQWAVVGAIAAIGIVLAYWVTSFGASPAQAAILPSSNNIEIVAQASPVPAASPPAPKPAIKPPAAKPPAAPARETKVTPAPSPAPVAKPTVTPDATTPAATLAPPWIVAIDEQLKPFAAPVSLFYVVADVLLLIIATMLLLAFWGGRFSQSWRMIAAAALSLYIADMWFKWAEKQPDYQSGSLPEVFWVFSGVLFAIGAALEYDTSTSSRSRRSGARKRG